MQSPQKQTQGRVSAGPVVFGIVVEVLFAAGLCLPHTSNPPIIAFCLAEAPYLVVLFMLLISAADPKRMQLWAKVAFGLGLLYAVLSAPVIFAYAIGLGFSDYPGKWVQAVSLFGLIPVNLYVVFAANAVGQGSLAQRILYPILKTAGAFILIVLGVWAHDKYDENRRMQRFDSMLNETQLIQVMNNVLACLQRYKLEKSSYPDSLTATAGVRGCSSLDANPGEVGGYTLSYRPIHVQALGKTESFQLEARSEGGWFEHAEPYIADSLGIIYRRTQFGMRPMVGSEGGMMLSDIRRCVERPASTEQRRDADGIVQDLQSRCPYRPGQWENQDGVVVFQMTGKTGYAVEMHVVLTGGQATPKITGSGRCANYAMNCVRSYLMDEKGAVHGTPEPRAATLDDPVVPACESSTAPCDWPLVN
jgi:hypothetical protein